MNAAAAAPSASEGKRDVAARRRLPFGAEVVAGGVHVRLWAPKRRRVQLVVSEGGAARAPAALAKEDREDGVWSMFVPGLAAGARYGFRLDDDEKTYPDPVSRYQPDGPHGLSEVVDPASYAWSDAAWRGVSLPGQVIYELHIGTFTPEGTWTAAAEKLTHLRDIGVTVVEVMPIAEFPGRFGWGYDGVDLYAPAHVYGRPDDLRRFVDRAHGLGLAVILDVVYNHFGPDGNYLEAFSDTYFAEGHTEWGRAINYDGPGSKNVRELVAGNAAHWMAEYHFDGLRLDATQSISDSSKHEHIVAELTRRAREAAGGRSIIVVAENEPQHTLVMRPAAEGGHGLDGMWNDDFHHTAIVAATGRREAYYTDYFGSAQEFLSAAKHGFLFQGQRYAWQKGRRGHPCRGIAPHKLINCLENHDQVANTLRGERLWQTTSPGRHRALTTLLLLGPWTPMLFQGQEWNASTPFLYFADHNPELANLVRRGRAEFMHQFPSCASPGVAALLADPSSVGTSAACRLRWEELTTPAHAPALLMHRDLLTLRRDDRALRAYAHGETGVTFDGAVLSNECFVLRIFSPDESADRALIVNLGQGLSPSSMPEPLLAPPLGHVWRSLFASDDARYGGAGAPAVESEDGCFTIPAHAAVLLAPEERGA